jgi:hypothetical protein
VLDRLDIYASLGVGEIWRWTDGKLAFLKLEADDYFETPTSRSFPFLGPEPLTRFLLEAHLTDETTWIRKFRQWVRETFPQGRGK